MSNKPQLSILGIMVLIAFAAVVLSTWRYGRLDSDFDQLKEHTNEIEQQYRIQAYALQLINSYDLGDEDQSKEFSIAKHFIPTLSRLDKIDPSIERPKLLGGEVNIVEANNGSPKLELLILTNSFKSSPGWDRSIVALFIDGEYVDRLTTETYYRIWHEVIPDDFDDDGITDFQIQKYYPHDPNKTKREVTEETTYLVDSTGFHEAKIDDRP